MTTIRNVTLLLGACATLSACATVGSYLNGNYNSAAFPPLDAPSEEIAMVSQSSVPDAACVLSAVDETPILVNPSGNGDGFWAKRVALKPGTHAVLTGWRAPGRYSPDALLCSADFAAGHRYTIDYDVTVPRKARVWIADAVTSERVADCIPRPAPGSSGGWPF